MTTFPPYCTWIEEIEGDFAGTKFVHTQRPEGAKTRIDVFGEAHCTGRSPEQTRTLFLEILAKAHEEDLATLRKIRERK